MFATLIRVTLIYVTLHFILCIYFRLLSFLFLAFRFLVSVAFLLPLNNLCFMFCVLCSYFVFCVLYFVFGFSFMFRLLYCRFYLPAGLDVADLPIAPLADLALTGLALVALDCSAGAFMGGGVCRIFIPL